MNAIVVVLNTLLVFDVVEIVFLGTKIAGEIISIVSSHIVEGFFTIRKALVDDIAGHCNLGGQTIDYRIRTTQVFRKVPIGIDANVITDCFGLLLFHPRCRSLVVNHGRWIWGWLRNRR